MGRSQQEIAADYARKATKINATLAAKEKAEVLLSATKAYTKGGSRDAVLAALAEFDEALAACKALEGGA